MAGVLAAATTLMCVPPGSAQSAAAPVFAVGDSWTRITRDTSRANFTYKVAVVRVEDGGTFTGGWGSCPQCLSIYDKQLRLIKLTRPDGSDVDPMQVAWGRLKAFRSPASRGAPVPRRR